jgi:diacyltrehalose acyltransferase
VDSISGTRQYDYASDFPDNQFNLLAVVNVFAGFAFLHDYRNVNPADLANARWTEGNITYILVPTPNLPLLEPLRLIGLTGLADALNAPLKALVEQGYNRPVPFPTVPPPPPPPPPPPLPPAASALSTSVVSDPTEAPQGATVKLSPAPAPAKAADSAPTATGPEQANGVDKGLAVADDTVTTTPPPDRADVPDTVKTTTPPAAQPRQDDAIAAKPSTTAPTTHTTPTTDGNKVEPGKVGEKQATTKSGDQATTKSGDQSPSTEDRENSAGSEE